MNTDYVFSVEELIPYEEFRVSEENFRKLKENYLRQAKESWETAEKFKASEEIQRRNKEEYFSSLLIKKRVNEIIKSNSELLRGVNLSSIFFHWMEAYPQHFFVNSEDKYLF